MNKYKNRPGDDKSNSKSDYSKKDRKSVKQYWIPKSPDLPSKMTFVDRSGDVVFFYVIENGRGYPGKNRK